MSLRRGVGFLTRRVSPRATPWTPPARSLHTLKDLPDGLCRATKVAAAALASAGAVALEYLMRKGPDEDESGTSYIFSCVAAGARKEEDDMKARFEDWMKKNDKTYRDDEEKAMRFQVFKTTVKWMESQPPSVQEYMLPEISYSADFTEEERPWNRSCIDLDAPQYREHIKSLAKYEKGKPMIRRPDRMQDDKRATRVSSHDKQATLVSS